MLGGLECIKSLIEFHFLHICTINKPIDIPIGKGCWSSILHFSLADVHPLGVSYAQRRKPAQRPEESPVRSRRLTRAIVPSCPVMSHHPRNPFPKKNIQTDSQTDRHRQTPTDTDRHRLTQTDTD